MFSKGVLSRLVLAASVGFISCTAMPRPPLRENEKAQKPKPEEDDDYTTISKVGRGGLQFDIFKCLTYREVLCVGFYHDQLTGSEKEISLTWRNYCFRPWTVSWFAPLGRDLVEIIVREIRGFWGDGPLLFDNLSTRTKNPLVHDWQGHKYENTLEASGPVPMVTFTTLGDAVLRAAATQLSDVERENWENNDVKIPSIYLKKIKPKKNTESEVAREAVTNALLTIAYDAWDLETVFPYSKVSRVSKPSGPEADHIERIIGHLYFADDNEKYYRFGEMCIAALVKSLIWAVLYLPEISPKIKKEFGVLLGEEMLTS